MESKILQAQIGKAQNDGNYAPGTNRETSDYGSSQDGEEAGSMGQSELTRDPKLNESPLAKVVAPFLTINIIASLVFVMWPAATPIFCAEFCLLAIWSAWGPGEFWKRFGTCVAIGALMFASQLYLWIVVFSVSTSIRVIFALVQWLFTTWVLAQLPLWAMRYVWQWRITDDAENDLERFSVNDNLIGITVICVAFATWRSATDFLIDEFGPFGFEKALWVYGLVLAEFYMLIALTGFATFLVFRLDNTPAKTIPLILAGSIFSVVSGYIWFPNPERWFVAGLAFVAMIMFAWAMLLPLNYIKKIGYRLFLGKHEIASPS